jgi:hypothetical protein
VYIYIRVPICVCSPVLINEPNDGIDDNLLHVSHTRFALFGYANTWENNIIIDLRETEMRMWSGFLWLKLRTNGGLL